MIAGRHTGFWKPAATHTALSTIRSLSLMTGLELIRTPSKAGGDGLRLFLTPTARRGNTYHLAQYLLTTRCRNENVHQFTEFLHIVANTDESLHPPLHPQNVAMCLQTAPTRYLPSRRPSQLSHKLL